MVNYQDFAAKALRDETLTRSECQAVLDTPDEQLLGLPIRLYRPTPFPARPFASRCCRTPRAVPARRLSLLFLICDLHRPIDVMALTNSK
jgi:hypothetical protein